MGKAQPIRVLDVVAIGPAMVWGGSLLVKSRPALGWFLVLSGVGTVAYNLANYQKIRAGLNGA